MANFLDGPYLDPIPGSQITSSALNGNVTLTFKKLSRVIPISNDLMRYSSPGADAIVLCDTNGGTLPQDVSRIVAAVCAATREARASTTWAAASAMLSPGPAPGA